MDKKNVGLLTGLAALLLLIVCGVSAYLLPHIPLVWQITGGLAIVAIFAWIYLEKAVITAALSKRTTQYGINSIFMSIVALVIVVVMNLIASEHDWKKDVTKNKVHTLSEQSIKVLRGLKDDVRMRAFVGPNQVADFQKIFDKYSYYSPKVKTDFVDLDKEPLAAKKYDVKQQGTIIIETENRSQKVDNIFGPDDPKIEEKITNAMIQVAKGDKKKVYFLTGHGERLMSDTGKEGYSEIKEALEAGRYKVEDLSLLDKDRVPADAEIVIDPAPKSDFMEHELKMLEDYLKAGGKLLVLLEPDSTATIKTLLVKYGIDWKDKDTILETNRLQQLAGGNPLTPIVVQYDTSHEITQDAKQPSLFPIATPVEKAASPPSNYKVTSLFSTSSKSFVVPLKTIQGAKDGRLELDENKNRKGPISLAVAVNGKAEKAAPPAPPLDDKKPDDKKDDRTAEFRLVVIGDSDFAANGARRFGINSDLFQNTMSWLAHEEDLIAIRPRPADQSEFDITEERARVINLASIILAPFGMFIAGIAIWLSRRSK
jgi:ABC-type uncharacterized transport system involved in gliding motility auxiliary subunit